MTVYEPGAVAVATAYGAEGVRVFRVEGSHPWRSANTAYTDDEVTDVRPLVVLDPQDIDTLDRLATLFHESWSGCEGSRGIGLGGALLKLNQPPRIPEPGLWGVVKASGPLGENESANEDEWVRTDDIVWRSRVTGWGVCWDQLADPVLVRDGIEDGAS